MTDTLVKMGNLIDQARKVYEDGRFEGTGMARCSIFGNVLKEHKLMLLGINPAGKPEKYTANVEKELELFKSDYNELTEQGKLNLWLRKFYDYAFGEKSEIYVRQTFYWNLCLFKCENLKKVYDSEMDRAMENCFPLFETVLQEVRPKVVLTFVKPFNFIEKRLNLSCANPTILAPRYYYYRYNNVLIGNYKLPKLVGMWHLSRSPIFVHTLPKFAKEFRNDCETAGV